MTVYDRVVVPSYIGRLDALLFRDLFRSVAKAFEGRRFMNHPSLLVLLIHFAAVPLFRPPFPDHRDVVRARYPVPALFGLGPLVRSVFGLDHHLGIARNVHEIPVEVGCANSPDLWVHVHGLLKRNASRVTNEFR